MKIIQGLILLLIFQNPLFAQRMDRKQQGTLLEQIEQDLKQGRKRSLRDLGSLLGKKETAAQARQVLKRVSLFTKEELDVNIASRDDFMSFYYDHEADFIYSELLHAFYLTPLETRKVDFVIRSLKESEPGESTNTTRQLFFQIDELLTAQDFSAIVPLVEQVGVDEKIEVQEMLLQLLQDGRLMDAPAIVQKEIYQKILLQLERYPDITIVELMLQMLDGGFIDTDFATPLLTNITNVTPELGTDFENIETYYQHLVDSLETLSDIRAYGYDHVFNFRLNFFQFPVDYYGKILGNSDAYPWIKYNALLDLSKVHHPRALFYIVTDLFRSLQRDSAFSPAYYFDLIQKQINVEVGVGDEKGQTAFKLDVNDETMMLHYLTYWASRYNDFEWNDNREIFTNKLETLAKTQSYERLFRRLNSRNDSIAIQSFVQLTEGDPMEIKALGKKYRQLLRNHNARLPSMKYKYLEQMALLTDYCRKEEISYVPSKKLSKQLELLLQAASPSERYAIENDLIARLDLKEITALEYWACLQESRKEISFSVGRVLDWFYSKNWQTIISDRNQLRLYLKKSYLLENIGVVGICNAYLNKFDLKNKNTVLQLHELSQIEADEDILNQLVLLLAEEPMMEEQSYSLGEFLEDPMAFNRRDIKILPSPTEEELKMMVKMIEAEEDMKVVKKLFSYLWLHPDLAFIPDLFKLIDDQRIVSQRGAVTVSVADNLVPIAENVYHHKFVLEDTSHPFATEKWRALWKKNQDGYKDWAGLFFREKLDSLQLRDELSIDDLNALAESPYFKQEHRQALLKALKKVKPIKHIRRLYLEPRLSVEDELIYFKDFYFSYKELDDIPKLFEVNNENAVKLLTFLEEKAVDFSLSERGSFYNNLFRSPWLSRYVDSGSISVAMAQKLRNALENYLNESEFLSEYEEQTTLLHMAQLDFIGKKLEEKLNAALSLDLDNSSRAKILQAIIATVRYEDLGIVARHFDALADVLGDRTYEFLNKDFGLPIFTFNSYKEQQSFIRHHEKMTEEEFYLHYLKKYGVDFLKKKRVLDYQKIYDILQFDIISPFAGSAGGKRDDYIYGIIKLLELQFDTRLGFHEKLNESQTFYNFSSASRAKAWQDYLCEHKLVDLTQFIPSSFNQNRQESVQ